MIDPLHDKYQNNTVIIDLCYHEQHVVVVVVVVTVTVVTVFKYPLQFMYFYLNSLDIFQNMTIILHSSVA